MQPPPPSYQDTSAYSNAGYAPSGIYPNPPGYTAQPIPLVQQVQTASPVQQTVIVQSMGCVAQPQPARLMPDYLCLSIFTMLFCCFPLGIAALFFSVFTRNANMSGQQIEAENNSRTAHSLNIAALVIGSLFLVGYIIAIVLLVF